MTLPDLVAQLYERELALARWYRAQCQHAHIAIKPTLCHFAIGREEASAKCASILQDGAGMHILPSLSRVLLKSGMAHACALLGTSILLKSALTIEHQFFRELVSWHEQYQDRFSPEQASFFALIADAKRSTASRISELELLAHRLL